MMMKTILARWWYRHAPSFPGKRKFYNITIYYDFRDNPSFWMASRKRLESFESLVEFIPCKPCRVWDVGCNVGYFSILCAKQGHQVVGFDLSAKALRLLHRGAQANGVDVTTVAQALTSKKTFYTPPLSANVRNKIVEPKGTFTKESITYLEAAERFGLPQLIKMDIEGSETEFFESQLFNQWLIQNHIAWIVELHHPDYMSQIQSGLRVETIDTRHVMINRSL